GESVMKAVPKKKTADILALLPRHLHGNHGGEGDQSFPGGPMAGQGQHHAPIPELLSNAKDSSTHPHAAQGNPDLNEDIMSALTRNNPLVSEEAGVPRFVIVWRIFPNAANPVVSAGLPGTCGCGCSCGG